MTAAGRAPTPAQRRYLVSIAAGDLLGAVVNTKWATRKACRLAGWTEITPGGVFTLTPLGRAALGEE